MKIHIPIDWAAVALCALAFPASSHPSSGIVMDRQGNVYFSDLSRGLLKIDTQGKLINANSEAHEDWPPRVRKMARDGTAKTLVTFAPGQGKPERN